jgi:hypothetical protein
MKFTGGIPAFREGPKLFHPNIILHLVIFIQKDKIKPEFIV